MYTKVKYEQINTLCHGCLTKDRTVHIISGDISEMFYGLRNDTNSENRLELALCWECVAFLKKLKMFQARIKTAQCLLIQYMKGYGKNDLFESLNSSLSSLYKFHINTFDYEFDEEKPIFQDLDEKYDVPVDCDDKELVDNENENLPAEELVTDIKVEYNNSIKEEYHSSNDNDSDNYEPEDNFEAQKSEGKSSTAKKCYKYKNYRIFATITRKDTSECVESVSLDQTEYDKVLKRDRGRYGYLKMSFKCDECKEGYLKKFDLQRHKSHCHSNESTFPYKCADCATMVTSLEQQEQHWTDAHSTLYKCTICTEVHQSAFEIKKHIKLKHRRHYTCNDCFFDCGTLVEFRKHYQVTHEKAVCDYCNKECKKKRSLISHIQFSHIPAYCSICKRTYANNKTFKSHNLALHPEQSADPDTRKELSYCVECDKQYSSEAKYKDHLRMLHNKKLREPCPDCGKIITRRNMKNHYRLAHLKVTKNHCEQCDKYYMTGYGLRKHITRFHKKIAQPKDKICDICGRGFSTKEVLKNHRRTHTGERPYKCQHCPAAFAQKYAMKSHEKTQHKNVDVPS